MAFPWKQLAKKYRDRASDEFHEKIAWKNRYESYSCDRRIADMGDRNVRRVLGEVYANLTATQARCTGLLDETRATKSDARTLLAILAVAARAALRGEMSESGVLRLVAELGEEAANG